MARRIEYDNDETYVTIHDENESIQKQEDDIYVIPIGNATPKYLTPKLVREPPQRIKKSTANIQHGDCIEKEIPRCTRIRPTVSDICDEDGYTLARPLDGPTPLGTLVTMRTSSCTPQENIKGSGIKENSTLPVYSKWKSIIMCFQYNKRCLVGACLVACIFVAFIVGFKLGRKPPNNNEDGPFMNGDVKLKDKNIPMIFWNGIWSPICGHYFWDNQIGAMLFCQKLGFEDGRVSGQRSGNSYTSDSFMVGKCNKGDTWTKCSGRCNRCSLGNCHQGPKCTRKQPVKIEIKCTGRPTISTTTMHSESDECFDTNGIRCVGCWGRKGKCNDFSYDRCSFSEYLGFKWCPVPRNTISQCNGGSKTEMQECCSTNNLCGLDEGNCDNDAECAGELVCGKDNCGPTFLWSSADCCKTKEGSSTIIDVTEWNNKTRS